MRTDFSHSSVIFLSIEIYRLVKIFKLKIRKPNENIFMIMIISIICITNNGFSFFNLISLTLVELSLMIISKYILKKLLTNF